MSDNLDQYDYEYPAELIAQEPAKPRDAARLLVYDRATKKVSFDTFKNLATYLPAKSVIVLNKTKVIPARLWARKPTGGKVQVFYIRHDAKYWYAMCDRPVEVGAGLSIGKNVLTVVGQENNLWILKPSFSLSRSLAFLFRYGTTPIPPYIKHTPLSERRLRQEYQAVFAKVRGSVAAPTASLHFTPRLLKSLKAAGHDIRYVTLHVGLGTFAPLTAEQLKTGILHSEQYEIDAATARALATAKKSGRPIIAVGTTVARTLESASGAKRSGQTNIFIRPGYQWKAIDGLITNFHVPKSSLLMLVSALVGRTKALDLYRQAIAKKFRLFSFGDGMLIR